MAYIRILGSGIKTNPNINYAALADLSSAGGTKTPAKSLGTKGPVTAPAGQPKAAKKAAVGGRKAPIVWFMICFIMTVIAAGVQFGFPLVLGSMTVLPSQSLILLGITITFLIPTTVLAFLSKTLLRHGWSLILFGVAWAVTTGVTTIMTFSYGSYYWYVPLCLGIAALLVLAGFVLRYFLSPSFKETLQ